MPKRKNIPCNNLFKFCKSVEPIMERDKINREEMASLLCWAVHQIKPHSLRIPENDNLYAIYSPHIKQDIDFLCKWLKTFVISDCAHFEECASEYLQSKGMSLDLWMDALCDGCKGHILTLYSLSMILDVHMVVHLCNGKIWTTMDSPPDEHVDLISKCLIHVAYLGQGLFVELVKCEKPLEVIKSVNGARSYVVGELTIIEQKTFDKMLRTGLGAGINMEDVPVDLSMPHTKLTEDKMVEITLVDLSTTPHHSNKEVETQSHSLENDSTQFLEPSALSANFGTAQESILTDKTTFRKSIGESTGDQSKSEPTTLRCENRHLYTEILGKMSLKVSVHKYEIINERQTIHITQNLMDN